MQKYEVVITNPPYMPPSMIQKKYVKKNYPDSKSDLFAIFIEKCHELTNKNAYQAMITMHSWMFLSSYEKLRKKLLKDNVIINMAHLGARAFEDIGGEVVQTTAFILMKNHISDYQSTYKRLVNYNSQDGKEKAYLSNGNIYVSSSENFTKIPESPIAYWISKKMLQWCEIFKLSNDVVGSVGIQTGDNEKYIRLWQELDYSLIKFNANQVSDTYGCQKWFPYNKGGDFRKWYGNDFYVVYWQNDGFYLKQNNKKTGHHYQEYKDNLKFAPLVTWSRVTSGQPSFRIKESGYLSDMAGFSIFSNTLDLKYIIAFCNSKVANHYLQFMAPTLNVMIGNVLSLPFDSKVICDTQVESIVSTCISLSKDDWDLFEESWNFKVHPLIKYHVDTISEAYSLWYKECGDRFDQLKTNEEELNKIFIDIYELQSELTPEVEDKDVTVRKADLVRDIKSLISYAVGCMFGRYSLDIEGLAYAGDEWNNNKYKTFIPDSDDIIPICDEDYFEDDIVSRFVEFIRCGYGDDTLEENLKFISDALGGNGNPRDVLRNYFLKEFFKDHCNTYQVAGSGKRPIYWQFDSGKKNGFKALVYIHRYTPDLIAKMRTGYIHPLQSQYRTQIEMLNNQIDESSSTSEKVKLKKQLKKITEQAEELGKYEEKIHHWADKMEPMNLDDGVVVNYNKFQELLVPNIVKKIKGV